jgi:hypothetical protein
MHVVCHQAVRVHLASKLSGVTSQDLEISAVIGFLEEAVSAIVPPLDNMDSNVGDD